MAHPDRAPAGRMALLAIDELEELSQPPHGAYLDFLLGRRVRVSHISQNAVNKAIAVLA